jgi:hypothetical protein
MRLSHSFFRREMTGVHLALKAGVLGLSLALAVGSGAVWADAVVTDGGDSSSSGQLRHELNNGASGDITFSVLTVTLTVDAPIAPTANADITLKGAAPLVGGTTGLAAHWVNQANSFLLTNPNATEINTYFGVGNSTFNDAVASAITDITNTPVVKGDGTRTTAAILDERDGFSLGFDGVAFQDFTNELAGNCNGGDAYCGGGVVGAFLGTTNATAALGVISNSIFNGNVISSDSDTEAIFGGGVAGVSSGDGNATFNGISGSVFSGNEVKDIGIRGGGVVGAYAANYGSASLGLISGSVFSGNEVKDSQITGGGIAGIYAADSASLGDISDNVFSGNEIKFTEINGGGVVGVVSSGSSSSSDIGNIENSVFIKNIISPVGDIYGNSLYGGGVVGVVGDSSGDISIGNINNSKFIGNAIEVSKRFWGGGVVGFRSNGGNVVFSGISNSTFSGNRIAAARDNDIEGGGVVGIYSYGDVTLGKIINSTFSENEISATGSISGGGVVGIQTGNDTVTFEGISESTFSKNTISATDGYISSGGVVGIFNFGAVTLNEIINSTFSENTVMMGGNSLGGGGVVGIRGNTATLGEIIGSTFSKNTISATDDSIRSGGVVGVSGDSTATLNKIINSTFSENTITAGYEGIMGGGVVGVSSWGTATLGKISGSTFTNNTVEATDEDYGVIWGGLIYTADDLILEDSTLTNNTFTTTGGDDKFFGTVSIDTSMTGATGNPEIHTVTLSATDGKILRFENNTINGNPANSVAFRNMQDSYSKADAVLNIDPHATGKVYLYDPIDVALDNGESFAMNVFGTGGEFWWGGNNTIETNSDGDAPEVTLKSGSKTHLLPGFGLEMSDALSAAPPAFTVKDGATLNVHGEHGKPLIIDGNLTANANAALNFYLPEDIAANDETLLIVTGTADIDNNRSINLALEGGVNPTSLAAGNSKITLIDAGTLKATGINTTSSVTATAGVAFTYNFGILVDPGDDTNLIAMLANNRPLILNPETKALAEGYLAGTALLNQCANYLIDRSVSSLLRAGQHADGERGNSFAALCSSDMRHETGSHIDLDSHALIAGLAFARSINAGMLHLGGFFEHGTGDYHSYNRFDARAVRSGGDVDYTGVGVLAHMEFNGTERGNFYAEGSARGGKVELDFASRDLVDAFGRRAAYEAKTHYLSVHAGLGYRLILDEATTLKFYGQYLKSRQGSDDARLTTGEMIRFQPISSRRARVGAKWERALNARANAYLGAAWEREFDGKSRSSIYGYQLDTPTLKGNTQIVELGLTLKPAPNTPWSLDIGLNQYFGRQKGVMGSVWLNYQFEEF